MTHFFALPREIREMIYEYCLVVDRVFPLFSSLSLEAYDFEDSPENQIPNIPLLRVSKQVAHEAEKILYSRNNFVVPIFEDMEKFFSQYLDTPRRNALPWIRSVEIALHHYDLSRAERKDILREEYGDLENLATNVYPLETADLGDWRDKLHDAFCERLAKVWRSKISLITINLRLQNLTIDLEDTMRTNQCCWLQDEAVECVIEGFAHGLPSNLGMLGTDWDKREMRARIVDGHLASQGPKGSESWSFHWPQSEGC